MLQPRISHSTLSSTRTDAALTSLVTALNSLSFCSKHIPRISNSTPKTLGSVRYASHAAQGRANGPKDSAGRRLGAKKSASEYVIPGNIIFKQRGTKWFPGENVGIGKDHTIYATVAGYVRYYRNPMQHPKRRYIGVALERDGPMSKLPTPPNAPTRRRLGMYATPIKTSPQSDKAWLESHITPNSFGANATATESETLPSTPPSPSSSPSIPKPSAAPPSPPPVVFRAGTYREANFSIGRAAERTKTRVREYDRKDRWLAWRKRAKKVKEGLLAKAAKATRKGGKAKAKKGPKAAAPRGRGK